MVLLLLLLHQHIQLALAVQCDGGDGGAGHVGHMGVQSLQVQAAAGQAVQRSGQSLDATIAGTRPVPHPCSPVAASLLHKLRHVTCTRVCRIPADCVIGHGHAASHARCRRSSSVCGERCAWHCYGTRMQPAKAPDALVTCALLQAACHCHGICLGAALKQHVQMHLFKTSADQGSQLGSMGFDSVADRAAATKRVSETAICMMRSWRCCAPMIGETAMWPQ